MTIKNKILATAAMSALMICCLNTRSQAELSLKKSDEDLYGPLDQSRISKLPQLAEKDDYKNTPRQMNIDLSDKFRYEQNGFYTSGGTDGVNIRVNDGPKEYCILIDREKNLGFPKRVFLRMNLDEQEPATMTFDYGNIKKTVLFPDMVGGKMRILGTPPSKSPMLSVYVGKDYLHESWIEEYHAAFKTMYDQLASYESEKSFSEKYIIPKKE